MKRNAHSSRSMLLAASILSFACASFGQAQPSASAPKSSLLVPAAPPVSSLAASAPMQPPAAAASGAKVSVGVSASKSVSSIIAAAAAASSPSPAASSQERPAAPSARARTASVPAVVAVDGVDLSRQQVATVQRRPDGTQVFKTPVSSAMLQEEQRVAALNSPPAVGPQGTEGQPKSASLSPSNLASFLGTAGETLPEWAKTGVSKTNGKSRLVVSQGVTEMVTIAKNFPNRFITPFDAAEVVTTDPDLSHEGNGGAVILATASDKPIGVFIQDKYSDRSIGLVLVPEVVPQRELRLVLDDTWSAPVLRANPETDVQLPAASNDYVEYVKTLLRALAKGEVPDGHALTPVDVEQLPKCLIPGVATKPAQMLEGPTTRIGVYVATNNSSSSVPVQESGCYRKGVLAVSAFPRPVLEAGQSTELYVLMRKDVVTQTVTGKRRPVLVSQ